MTRRRTIEVHELTPAQGYALFSKRCRDHLGVDADEFLAAHETREYPPEWDQSDVLYLEMLLPFAIAADLTKERR